MSWAMSLDETALPGDSSSVRSASTNVCIMPSVSSGRLLIILKPFHMYIISYNEAVNDVGRTVKVKLPV